MRPVLIASLCAAGAAYFFLAARDARRELELDAPVDVTPAVRAAARNGHLAALFASIGVLALTRQFGRWYVVLPVFLASRILVEMMLRRATRAR